MGQALYRKYRSKSFADVIGQDHITKTLSNAIKAGRISHAYLFTGPRGVGKTSIARILAHEVNGLPYSDESIHLDIIEIDAASNRRIDEIRDLREKVKISPTEAKYKVYIVDEVHMLTREAFNALLKTLEEPPAHCIFILATTEAHKLPETIVSRTQRFEFKPINPSQSSQHLSEIAKLEKIDIEKPALDLIALHGNGSFRDSISFLDQLSSYGGKISADDVSNMLGLPAGSEITKLVGYIKSSDTPAVLKSLDSLEQTGASPQSIAESISMALRRKAVSNTLERRFIMLLSDLLEVSASHRPKEALEIALFTACSEKSSQPKTPTMALDISPIKKIQILEVKKSGKEQAEFSLDVWDEVVSRSKLEAASIYTALRLAKPVITNNVLLLSFQFPLHQKKINLTKNKTMVSQIIYEVCGSKVIIETAVDKSPAAKQFRPDKPDGLGAISNIFGSAEVVEA